MKENDKGPAVLAGQTQQHTGDASQDDSRPRIEKFKKPVIFILMGIVFLGCMYLIFIPSDEPGPAANAGLNEAVPQATGAGMQPDKRKAYEQAQLERQEQEKKDALASLSDYWNTDGEQEDDSLYPGDTATGNEDGHRYSKGGGHAALNSYRHAQSTLGSFYDNNDDETQALRKQLDDLKEKLAAKQVPPDPTVEDQLALVEKSYAIAAKYLPSNGAQPDKTDTVLPAKVPVQQESFAAFTPETENAVSALYREPSDSAFPASPDGSRDRQFYTIGIAGHTAQTRNSIRAVVQETQTVTDGSGVRVRLLEAAQTPGTRVPAGTVLTAYAKFQNSRLQLQLTSVETEGRIVPVAAMAYDLDGQQGLYIPYSPEMNALTEMAAGMGQSSGTSLMMTRSAGQQVAGDLSRGLIQGISGYFSRKARAIKVTVKAGHQLWLVPEK
ncbi:MAG: conjugative transposon protein TraM [Chitinophagaceae bacterium]